MVRKKLFLTIDRGQTSIKVALYTISGKSVITKSLPCQPIQTPHPGWAVQDMGIIWRQTKALIRRVLNETATAHYEIIAVSLSGQGGGNFLISERGEPVYPGVLSMDSRHQETIDEIQRESKIEDSSVLPRTVLFMRWLKDKEPDIYRKVKWILGSKDWIRYKLTGEPACDMSDTPVPVNFQEKSYKTHYLLNANIPECIDMLPPLKYATEIGGHVTTAAAAETGLPPGIPVVIGAHDMIACSVGTGGNHQGHLTIILGTMGINIATADRLNTLQTDTTGNTFIFGNIVPDHYTVTSSIGSGCNTLNWFLDTLFTEEKRQAAAESKNIYQYLETKLSKLPLTEIIFQPYLLGTFYNPYARAGIFGITSRTTREELILSMYQGICLSMCLEIRKLSDSLQHFDDIWITGGGSNSSLWCQMFSDALGLPVSVSDNAEAGCRGAAICAGIALGYYGWQKNFPAPHPANIYYPDETQKKSYQDRLALYEYLYESVSSVYKHKK